MVRNTVDAKLEKQLSQLAASLGHVSKKLAPSSDSLEDIQVCILNFDNDLKISLPKSWHLWFNQVLFPVFVCVKILTIL